MIYVIVPVFNRAKITLQFLDLLYAQQYQEFKAVVVDDGSSDNTSEMIRKQYPGC